MKKFIYFSFFAAIVGGCATSSNVSEKTAASEAGTATAMSVTPESLAEGQKLYLQNCGRCHALHEPIAFSKQEWEKILPSMIRKAKLAPTEGGVVHQYVFSEIEKGSRN